MADDRMSKSETIRNTVQTISIVIGTAITAYVAWRVIAGPDSDKQLSLRYCQWLRKYAQAKELHWHAVYERAGNVMMDIAGYPE